ncbi:hypothetical protein B0H10DRAFT_545716 [Mycena sp. CBHHK59/15]|nr:hypothetical protein B0H10DRAFT_545716 [Mycena sp. CBHHK59/15]
MTMSSAREPISSRSLKPAGTCEPRRSRGYFVRSTIGVERVERCGQLACGLSSTVHIRDRSIRHPADIPLLPDMFGALPMMPALTKVTLRLDAPIPAELLRTLSSVPHLAILEIHQARFDGTSPPPSLPFAALESLLICISGFQGVIRGENIDRAREIDNISGDFLGSGFLSLRWLRLQKFSITEHTPTPYIPVPELISGMPALRDLSVLFSADLTRDSADLYPPFRLGIPGGELLTPRSPLLATITLSNLEPADPIFAQLPRSLESLHLLAMGTGTSLDPGRPSTSGRLPSQVPPSSPHFSRYHTCKTCPSFP